MRRRFTIILLIIVCIRMYAQISPAAWIRTLTPAAGAIYDVHDMVHDSKGFSYIVGTFISTVDFDPSAAVHNLTSSFLESVFLIKLSPAGNLQWVKSWGSNLGTNTRLAIDKNDNLYLAGPFVGVETFSVPSTSYAINTKKSAVLMKISTTGTFLWIRELTGNITVNGFSIGPDQEPVAIGDFRGNVNFDRGSTTHTFSSGNGGLSNNLYFLKFSANGNLKFVNTFENYYNAAGNAVTIDNDNSIYISAFSKYPIDIDPGNAKVITSDAIIGKFDSVGKYLQHVKLSGEIKVTSLSYANGIYGCGIIGGTLDCIYTKNNQTLTAVTCNTSNVTGFFFQLDTALVPNYFQEIRPGNNQSSLIRNLKIHPNNSSNLYLFTEFQGEYDFDPGTGTSYLQATPSNYNHLNLGITKYSNSGLLNWAANFGPAGFSTLPCDVDKNEAIYISARYDNTFDADPSPSVNTLSKPVRPTAFISKFFECRPELNPSLYVNQDKQYVCDGEPVTLNAYGADFYYWEPEATNSSTFQYIANGTRTIEVFGFNELGCYSSFNYTVTTDACTGLQEHEQNVYAIYPNPSSDKIQVKGQPGDRVTVVDTAGRVIKQQTLHLSEASVDLKDLTDGIYIVQLSDRSGKVLQSKKVVKR